MIFKITPLHLSIAMGAADANIRTIDTQMVLEFCLGLKYDAAFFAGSIVFTFFEMLFECALVHHCVVSKLRGILILTQCLVETLMHLVYLLHLGLHKSIFALDKQELRIAIAVWTPFLAIRRGTTILINSAALRLIVRLLGVLCLKPIVLDH